MPDGPLDEASPLRCGCAKVTREVSVMEEAGGAFFAASQLSYRLGPLMDPGGAQAFDLGGFALDLGVVLFFILLASIFVAAEIALISLREGQVKALAEKGKRGARVAKLAASPNRFLAAVQVGVTLSGFLSAAFGAERLGNYVIPRLVDAGLSTGVSETLSLIGLTLIIAYFSLVFGELVPKR